jgi:uncharacterized protein (TIGR00288 family)
MKATRSGDGERALAVFIDFENLGLGFQNRRDRFDIHKVLERLVEKGKIVAKKAYADWSRFSSYTTALHEAAIELVEIPRRGVSGKNSADIRLVVDAIDLAYSKDHIDTFVIVSGDSDFSPLVSKLKELGKHVIGMGLADATSDLLRDNCDEFIYYEDLDRAPILPVSMNENIPERKRKAFALLLESLLALRRENKEIIYPSMIKDTMKRKKPSFNEEYYGYRTFSEFLEDAQRLGLLELEMHKPSGMYIVTRFGLEMTKQGGPGVEGPGRSAVTYTGSSSSPVSSEVSKLTTTRAADEERAGIMPRESFPGEDTRRFAPTTRSVASSPAKHADLNEPLSPIERPLGRALVEEAEWDDEELEQIPSYGITPPPLVGSKSRSSSTEKASPPSPAPSKSMRQAEISGGKGNVSLPAAPRSSRSAPPSQGPRGSSATPAASSRKTSTREDKRGGGSAHSGGRRSGSRNGGSSSARRSSYPSDTNTPNVASAPDRVESPQTAEEPSSANVPTPSPGKLVPPTVPSSCEIDEEAEFRAGLED